MQFFNITYVFKHLRSMILHNTDNKNTLKHDNDNDNDNEITLLGTGNNIKNCIMEETMVLIMLVSYTCVCPGDLVSANNAAIIRPPK